MLSTRIVPPFTAESAAAKVQMAENAWNSKDPSASRAGLLSAHGADYERRPRTF
jgi:nuclear transport factor 2 (NTF2) superfamily protein